MNATTMPSPASFPPSYLSQQLRRFAPMIIIIGLHVVLFYAFRSGLMHQAEQVLPREIVATFVTLQTPAPEPKSQPVPKTVPVAKKPITKPKPHPIITDKPAPPAITEEAPPPTQPSNEPPSDAPPIAAPSAPPAQAVSKLISGVSYINPPRPVYPPLDARMGNEGTVTLRVLINEKGRAEKVEVQKSSGSLRMDDAARDAVMRALFKPYMGDGKPAPAYAIVPINFTLNR